MTSKRFDHQRDPARAQRRTRQAGLTLLELVVVVAILAILAGFIIPLAEGYLVSGRQTVAQASLAAVRDAIMGTPDKPGYYADTGQLPSQVADLFVQPVGVPAFDRDTRVGSRGPYLMNTSGANAVLDPWGQPIVLQFPTSGTTDQNNRFARLISGGPNHTVDTLPDYPATATPYYPPISARGDDIVLFIRHADTVP